MAIDAYSEDYNIYGFKEKGYPDASVLESSGDHFLLFGPITLPMTMGILNGTMPIPVTAGQI